MYLAMITFSLFQVPTSTFVVFEQTLFHFWPFKGIQSPKGSCHDLVFPRTRFPVHYYMSFLEICICSMLHLDVATMLHLNVSMLLQHRGATLNKCISLLFFLT